MVEFNFQKAVTLQKRKRLKQFIQDMILDEKNVSAAISFVFCSDDYLLEINRSYLNHDYFTDIITFDLSDSKSTTITSEIYISVDTVRSNAARFGQSFQRELHRVVFHGVLHLCGYGDKTPKEKKRMTALEDKYLQSYFAVPRETE